MLRQVRFSSSKYSKMRMRRGSGKLQSFPRLPSWFSGSRFAAGKGKGGGEGRGGGKGRGIAFPHFFFYNLTTAQQCIVAATYTRSLDLALQLCAGQSIAIMHID